MSEDRIFADFLSRQLDEGRALSRASDIVLVSPWDPQHFVLRFRCRGLVLDGDTPRVHEEFRVGVFFPPDYVRVAQHAARVITWLGPESVFHPNVRPPFVCLGPIAAGESLTDLSYRLYEVISYHRASPHDALNLAAAQWARHHQSELPLDRRPLRRRAEGPR